jgi:hypothetical protein
MVATESSGSEYVPIAAHHNSQGPHGCTKMDGNCSARFLLQSASTCLGCRQIAGGDYGDRTTQILEYADR